MTAEPGFAPLLRWSRFANDMTELRLLMSTYFVCSILMAGAIGRIGSMTHLFIQALQKTAGTIRIPTVGSAIDWAASSG